jgi:undecaprenyl diphosphate synthase
MHLAIIMDGNRRWAKKHGWKKFFGHQTGIKLVKQVLDWCPKYQIDILSVYALSTENLQRDSFELSYLFKLIKSFAKDKEDFKNKNIKVKILGNTQLLPTDVQETLSVLENFTKNCTGVLFQICVSYGGRDEITRSVEKLTTKKEEITEANISKNLDSNLEPDLLIRTGGHKRLSNFLMWQSAYTELLFLDKMWPEFTENDLKSAVKHFQSQQRNFGE